ncbi:hypothetical protein ACFOLJ_18260 [Rugamonas sp. CCM 8940]|uniref:hypothetical protein n=1 Tax=Rugamonas sp. CCM 8940 TaxID=2765359 RepID=UPI0018F6035D|nr:hypothetical protein [Rugamonas sp. CCM 8940]MBJ7310963.1 hypothetical protein [Rugamonas sp. CCM 8940]
MDERLTALETHFNTILPTLATKADIESLRVEMYKMSSELHKWMLASMVGMFLGFSGLYFASNTAARAPHPAPMPAQPAQSIAPIVIYLPAPPATPSSQPAPQK